eukprot:9499666-Pyramimonas_sp.AAC.3
MDNFLRIKCKGAECQPLAVPAWKSRAEMRDLYEGLQGRDVYELLLFVRLAAFSPYSVNAKLDRAHMSPRLKYPSHVRLSGCSARLHTTQLRSGRHSTACHPPGTGDRCQER